MYQIDTRVRYSEIGPDKLLTLSGIINYFQDCSTFQSEDICAGLAYLEEQHRAWILNSWQIVIERLPNFGEKLTVGTWAYDFKGTYGYRNFLLLDEKGNPLAYANSIWIYMDTMNLRILRIPPEVALRYPHEEKYPMEYSPRKIHVPETYYTQSPFPVVASNIDTNNHVNNGQYVRMAEIYLPPQFKVHQMRAEYRSSAHLGDMITPKIYQDENLSVVTLCSADDSIYAIIEFTCVHMHTDRS